MKMYPNIIYYFIISETLWAFVLSHFGMVFFCSAWDAFDIQGIILFYHSDYVAIKSSETELPPTVCKVFDEEKHYL